MTFSRPCKPCARRKSNAKQERSLNSCHSQTSLFSHGPGLITEAFTRSLTKHNSFFKKLIISSACDCLCTSPVTPLSICTLYLHYKIVCLFQETCCKCLGASLNMYSSLYASANKRLICWSSQLLVGRFCSKSINP